jgi:hypothetical protein
MTVCELIAFGASALETGVIYMTEVVPAPPSDRLPVRVFNGVGGMKVSCWAFFFQQVLTLLSH